MGRVRSGLRPGTVDEGSGVKINQVVEVERDADRVWELFQDVPQLAGCLPGAELTEEKGDGVYAGKVVAKLGPMTAAFEGEATVASDAETRTGSVNGKGMDKQGGSVGQVKMAYTVAAREGGGTVITVDADVVLSGAAAQFGRTGLVKEMSNRLIGEFVKCVEAKLAAETAAAAAQVKAPEVKGFSLVFSSLIGSLVGLIKRVFGGRT